MEASDVISAMIEYNKGDKRRIAHLLKVYAYAKTIGELEGLDEKTRYIVEVAAAVHDIGIRNSEKQYHSSAGVYQEQVGPPEAEKLLEGLGVSEDVIRRVSYLVGHHHTYTNIDGMDYQILVEADFLVNLEEENSSREAVEAARNRIFQTKTGICFLDRIFL